MSSVLGCEKRDGIALVTLDHPPVNALNQTIRQALIEALSTALRDRSVDALLLTGRGHLFSAGADINEFGDATRPPPYLREVVLAFDASTKPIVAAIRGAAFGGGLELAMACQYRVSTPDAKLALSEVKFGIIPGAGGTQLLPRLVGPEKALEMITTGEPVDGREAAALGLVDRLSESDLLDNALAFARTVADRSPLPRTSRRDGRLAVVTGFFDAAAKRVGNRARGARAPRMALAAVRAAVELPFERGIEREREIWAAAAASAEASAMRYAFVAEKSAAKLRQGPQEGPPETLPSRIATAAIVGTGTMGTGIAMSLANAGIDVTLVGRARARVDAALAAIVGHYDAAVARGRLTASEAQTRRARIVTTTSWERLAGVDLAIETVIEDPEAKRRVFARLDAACPPTSILGTNTSSLRLDVVAGATRSPARLVGLHYFSPAQATKLLEIVRGEATSPVTVARALALAKQLGKIGVVVGDGSGPVSTRMFRSYQRSANRLLLEGALPHEVDGALVSFGMAMGPLAAADLAGLDVARRIRRLEPSRPAATLNPDVVADRLAELGRLGQKTGRGYYRYEPGGRSPLPDADVVGVIAELATKLGVARRRIEGAEIVRRCLFAIVTESEAAMDEAVVSRTSDIDVIWINGYGFPRHRGGPVYHAIQRGWIQAR
jgi:3-hydroxyacyl-CoA dehydrogenase